MLWAYQMYMLDLFITFFKILLAIFQYENYALPFILFEKRYSSQIKHFKKGRICITFYFYTHKTNQESSKT